MERLGRQFAGAGRLSRIAQQWCSQRSLDIDPGTCLLHVTIRLKQARQSLRALLHGEESPGSTEQDAG